MPKEEIKWGVDPRIADPTATGVYNPSDPDFLLGTTHPS